MYVANCQKLSTISAGAAEIKAAEIYSVKNVQCASAMIFVKLKKNTGTASSCHSS